MTTPLKRFRREKDHHLETDPNSPLYGVAFVGLSCYPEAESYAVTVGLGHVQGREVMLLSHRCPLPPPENSLPVPIYAGEKL